MYKSSEQRLAEGYYYSAVASSGKRKIVCIYDSKIKSGGLADRLRGILSIYHICRKINVVFKILFCHPFNLERYLVPNKVQWSINQNDLNYNLATTDLCFVSSRTAREYEMKKQEKWFKKEFKKEYDEYHVRTNAAFSYKYDFATLFSELFQPSPLLVSLIDEHKEKLGDEYISASFRFMDLLGDFNETVGKGMLETEVERRELVGTCLMQIEILHKKNPGKKILVNSDSKTFLQAADLLDYTYVIHGEIGHVDSPEEVEEGVHDKTFIDFFMIANASNIYCIVADGMYDSGFPYAASRLYDRPYRKIC